MPAVAVPGPDGTVGSSWSYAILPYGVPTAQAPSLTGRVGAAGEPLCAAHHHIQRARRALHASRDIHDQAVSRADRAGDPLLATMPFDIAIYSKSLVGEPKNARPSGIGT